MANSTALAGDASFVKKHQQSRVWGDRGEGRVPSASSRSSLEGGRKEDLEALNWAALERLPTYDCLNAAILEGPLGEDIAATVVQSRYRGHVVRQSQPLTQLRKIAVVGKRLTELEKQASAVEFQEEIRRGVPMAKVRFVESTMTLLFQLDAIHGAHPVVREIRKTMAQEIILLQERIDALLEGPLREDIAATVVQSRYRGHVVRQSQPLTQLRKIAVVGKRLTDLEKQASAVEFQEEIRRGVPMAKVRFVESTMALLFQLDAIHGAHPVVREIRKTMAREIILLQERIDALN